MLEISVKNSSYCARQESDLLKAGREDKLLMLTGKEFHARTTRLWKQLKVTLEIDLGYLKDMPLLELEGAEGGKKFA